MGDLSTALVIATTSFLLGRFLLKSITTVCCLPFAVHIPGILAMHWTADHLLLWQSPITRESLLSAQLYYHVTLVNMPHPFHVIQLVLATSGAAILITKVLGGRESNWLFDGASLFLYGATAVVHVQKILPSLVDLPPLTPVPKANPANPRDNLLVPLRELASSNAVQAAALVGVLILQSGQYYSERLERRERIEETEARLRRKRRRLERSSQQALRESAAAATSGETSSAATSPTSDARAR